MEDIDIPRNFKDEIEKLANRKVDEKYVTPEFRHESLKLHVIETLSKMAELIQEDKYEEAVKHLRVGTLCPAQYFINFGINDSEDILSVIGKLNSLKSQIDKSK